MAKLAENESLSARALEFLILTAARTSEVIGATWSEIDLGAAAWTVPGERMKAGKAHVVPLSDAALDILRSIRRSPGGSIFPLSNMAMLLQSLVRPFRLYRRTLLLPCLPLFPG